MNDADPEVLEGQLVAAQRLPPDLMLLKMENESIMAVARTSPRDPMKIVAQLKQLIDAYPAAADEAIYSKPVGTVTQVTCGDCGIKYEVNKVDNETACTSCESKKRGACRPIKKFAEGLSIRAAESIRSIFGYTRLATTCEMLPDGSAKLTGVLVDYAAGNVTSDERIVSQFYKAKGGGMTRTPEDRFINVVVKAEKSKLRRDVILDSTPGIVKAMFWDACEQKLVALVSPELIEQRIIPAFAEYGITREHLDKIVGRPAKLGWREEERLSLKKILTAIKNEETTVAELLAGLNETPGQPSGPVTGEDLAKANGTRRDPSGAHADLPADHGKQPQKQEAKESPKKQSQQSTTPEDKPSDEDLLNDLERELAGINKVTLVSDAVTVFAQKHPHLQAKIDELSEVRKSELRGERKKEKAGA